MAHIQHLLKNEMYKYVKIIKIHLLAWVHSLLISIPSQIDPSDAKFSKIHPNPPCPNPNRSNIRPAKAQSIREKDESIYPPLEEPSVITHQVHKEKCCKYPGKCWYRIPSHVNDPESIHICLLLVRDGM